MKLNRAAELSGAFAFGGILYGAVETLWRGYTHPTMLFAGGVSFAALYFIDGKRPSLSIWQRMLCGAFVITLTELTFGLLLNTLLGLRVWDYSGRRLHLWGQICALYSGYWALLSVPAFGLCRLLRRALGQVDHSASASG